MESFHKFIDSCSIKLNNNNNTNNTNNTNNNNNNGIDSNLQNQNKPKIYQTNRNSDIVNDSNRLPYAALVLTE